MTAEAAVRRQLPWDQSPVCLWSLAQAQYSALLHMLPPDPGLSLDPDQRYHEDQRCVSKSVCAPRPGHFSHTDGQDLDHSAGLWAHLSVCAW